MRRSNRPSGDAGGSPGGLPAGAHRPSEAPNARPQQSREGLRPAPAGRPPLQTGESAAVAGGSARLGAWRERRSSQARRRRSGAADREELLAAVFDQSPIATLRVRRDGASLGAIVDANAAAGALLGRLPSELVTTELNSYFSGRDQLRLGAVPTRREVRVRRKGGEGVWVVATVSALDEDAGPDLALVVLQDVTELRSAQERLDRVARRDSLTGLINREELLRRLASQPAGTCSPPHHVGVIFADLDGFKLVNDTRGHQVGDEVLTIAAHRIRSSVRPGDSVGRMGGDEFVVVCPGLADPRQSRTVAERIRASLARPVVVDGRPHQLGASLGISTARCDRIEPDELLRRADLAMYRAKQAGGNAIRFYEAQFDRQLEAAQQLRERLRKAVTGQGLSLHYQPVVEIASGRLVYVEVLARLVRGDGSMIDPEQFIPVAESDGIIADLGGRILAQALDQRSEWLAAGHDVMIGLNLSPVHLNAPEFGPGLLAALAEHGSSARALVLEISETGALDAAGPARKALRRLRAAGVAVAIDHFGTGNSSLAALRSLPADRVKIDRSFVTSVAQSTQDRAVVAAVISVAHALGQRVIADGVETPQQLAILAELGCDDAQGFLVAPSGPPDGLGLGRERWIIPRG